jgi:hypothetical protein
VTASALPERLDVIDESIITPRRRLVATVAQSCRLWMRLRLAGSRHGVVAADTSLWGVAEASVDVTRRASDAEMGAGEGESRGKVIERRA